MSKKILKIGTRGSKLALWQANLVSSELSRHFDGEITLEVIKTTGDKILDSPLSEIGDKGLFVKEIEKALLEGKVDLAVHSLKDLPTELPSGLMLAGVLKREDPRDAFISLKFGSFMEMPDRAVIATSSLRRRAQILHHKPGMRVVDIRGNVDTRVRKLEEGFADASIMAVAGLKRMGLASRVTEVLSTDIMLPAVGQGCIAIETRSDDKMVTGIVKALDFEEDHKAVRAERALMRFLEGGCQVPLGALAHVEGDTIILDAMVASPDGSALLRDSLSGAGSDPEALGIRMGESLIGRGADSILEKLRK